MSPGTRRAKPRPVHPLPRLSDEDAARFWGKVKKGRKDHCWEWTAGRYSAGDGAFHLPDSRGRYFTVRAARVAYRLAYGKDPGKQRVCRRCFNRVCCNPAHLYLGTNADTARALSKLTIEDVRAIRRGRARGEKYGVLAQRFGVERTTAYDIATGRSWRGVR